MGSLIQDPVIFFTIIKCNLVVVRDIFIFDRK